MLHYRVGNKSACGREVPNVTIVARATTCERCKRTTEYKKALVRADSRRQK